MQNNYKGTITKTILITFSVILGVFAIVVAMMYFVFTKNLADLMYNIGSNNIASELYYKTYKKSDDIGYCYKALTLKISLKDYSDVVDFYEVFVQDDEYEDFMLANEKMIKELNIGVLEKSSMLNEDNYLVNNYVKALFAEGKEEKARQIACDEFNQYTEFTFYNQGVYALGQFESTDSIFDTQLVDNMQMYFDNACIVFDENKDSEDSLDKAYLVALANRIILVGQNINNIYIDNDVVENANMEKMTEINDVIKGLL